MNIEYNHYMVSHDPLALNGSSDRALLPHHLLLYHRTISSIIFVFKYHFNILNDITTAGYWKINFWYEYVLANDIFFLCLFLFGHVNVCQDHGSVISCPFSKLWQTDQPTNQLTTDRPTDIMVHRTVALPIIGVFWYESYHYIDKVQQKSEILIFNRTFPLKIK